MRSNDDNNTKNLHEPLRSSEQSDPNKHQSEENPFLRI